LQYILYWNGNETGTCHHFFRTLSGSPKEESTLYWTLRDHSKYGFSRFS
jgi:hypothetical protein